MVGLIVHQDDPVISDQVTINNPVNQDLVIIVRRDVCKGLVAVHDHRKWFLTVVIRGVGQDLLTDSRLKETYDTGNIDLRGGGRGHQSLLGQDGNLVLNHGWGDRLIKGQFLENKVGCCSDLSSLRGCIILLNEVWYRKVRIDVNPTAFFLIIFR